MISTNSSLGQSDSMHTTPLPFNPRLKNPSPPANAEENVFLLTAFCFNVDSQAKNSPSSNTIELPHSSRFNKMICLYVGSKTRVPSPVYSGLITDSPVTFPRIVLDKKSPAPLIPVVAETSPAIHCMAPD